MFKFRQIYKRKPLEFVHHFRFSSLKNLMYHLCYHWTMNIVSIVDWPYSIALEFSVSISFLCEVNRKKRSKMNHWLAICFRQIFLSYKMYECRGNGNESIYCTYRKGFLFFIYSFNLAPKSHFSCAQFTIVDNGFTIYI